MRKTGVGILIAVFILGAVAVAANQYGIADKREITFFKNVKVGDTLLPAGNYTVVHQMQGTDHIMVFTGKKAEAKVKCTLTPLTAPALRTETEYKVNASDEQVLVRMVFRGDRAEHRF